MNDLPPEAEALVQAVKKYLSSKEFEKSCFFCCEASCQECPRGNLLAVYGAFRAAFPDDDTPLPDDPPHWLTIKEAQRLQVCRVCREKAAPKQRPDGTMNSFWLGHGHEHAHEDCLTPAATKRMLRKIAETGPHRMD